MKLNIYDKKKIVKTYEADTYDLLWGVLEDVADAVKLDDLKTGSDVEILKMVANTVLHSMDTVKGLLKDIFEDITEEEIRNTRISEIAVVLVDVVKYTITQLNINFPAKN